MSLYRIIRPLIFRSDAEDAHGLTLRLLKSGLAGFGRGPETDASLATRVFGIEFPNPLGLAAGFDKNAEVPAAMLGLGFGFVEVGSVTPRPQDGNARPRLFRLTQDRAVINRMGFNNDGHEPAHRRLAALGRRSGPIGVNLGANKDSADRIADYALGIVRFNDVADYITVNISSPNTPGLRALQSRAELTSLFHALGEARRRLAAPKPLLIKLAPDLRADELEDVAEVCLAERATIAGLIMSNTTLERPATLLSPQRGEAGGLSGAPLFELATRKLAELARLTRGEIPLVGAGGISDAETAWAKITAGASLLQLYSALVYEGPGLARRICRGLAERCRREGFARVADAVGSGTARWTR